MGKTRAGASACGRVENHRRLVQIPSEAWLREAIVAETQPLRDLTPPLGVRGIKRSLLEVAGQGLTGSVCIRFVPQTDDVPRSVLFRQQVPRLLSASSRAVRSAARLATR